MSYRSIHKANEAYQLTVMWLLIGAFVVAMALMFIHPTGALLLFFMGLGVVLVAGLIEKLFVRAERSAARDALKGHACPSGGAGIDWEPGAAEWHCEMCGSNFLDSGTEQPPGESSP